MSSHSVIGQAYGLFSPGLRQREEEARAERDRTADLARQREAQLAAEAAAKKEAEERASVRGATAGSGYGFPSILSMGFSGSVQASQREDRISGRGRIFGN